MNKFAPKPINSVKVRSETWSWYPDNDGEPLSYTLRGPSNYPYVEIIMESEDRWIIILRSDLSRLLTIDQGQLYNSAGGVMRTINSEIERNVTLIANALRITYKGEELDCD